MEWFDNYYNRTYISNIQSKFQKKKKKMHRILLAIERAEYHIINEPKMTKFEYFHILYFE